MSRTLPSATRRLVLGVALALAALVAILPESAPVRAALPAANTIVLAQEAAQSASQAARDAAREAAQKAREVAREANEAARQAAREARRQDVDIDIDIGDDKDGRRKGVTIGLGGVDREYDSFDQFLDRDPALAAMVLGIVFIVFLTPILIIALIIWYKVRKNRMQNETMLQLAERGIVPPGEALQAIGSGRIEPVIGAAASNAPLTEQMRTLRKQAAWSDLRKGVLIGGVGFAITLYSILEERSPGWIGLVLLFVGIGYVVLWFFEDRQAFAARTQPVANPGPGDRPN